MSISEELAEKLLVIANNIATESEAVEQQTELLQQTRTALVGKTVPGNPGDSGSYDEGYADGQQNVLDIVNYELAGRDLETAETADDVSSALDNAFIEVSDVAYGYGKQAEYDAFWDSYQQNGNRTDYRYAFGGTGWNDETFKPKYPIAPVGDAATENTFYASEITNIPDGLLDFSQVTYCYMTFRQSKLITAPALNLTNCTKGTNWLFGQCANLKEIKTLTVSEVVTFINIVMGCAALEKITFAGTIGQSLSLAWSPLLTNESVQSIIDHLKDLTGATAQTLTFHATVGGKLTQAQKDAISAKNWTLVY